MNDAVSTHLLLESSGLEKLTSIVVVTFDVLENGMDGWMYLIFLSEWI